MGRRAGEGRLSGLECRLYLITPAAIDDLDGFASTLAHALDAGDVGALQLRLKGAEERRIEAAVQAIRPILADRDIPLILNDSPELALRFGCDGVHVGQDDAPCEEARRIVGQNRVVGVTCHDSRHLAIEAAEAGADYVAFGAFFPTTTKAAKTRPDPEILEIWQETMLTPCVAIGGVTPENCRALVVAGADFLAVVGCVWNHPDGPAAGVRALNAAIRAA